MDAAQLQGRLWGAAADDWSEITEAGQLPFYRAVFAASGVGTGTRLLDAGCGAGMAMQVAQEEGAIVAGLDASAGLLAVAGRRVGDEHVDQGDLEHLPYPDDSFDVVTAFNSVQYAADPVRAVHELRRVTVPGGRVGIVTWAEAERCETRVVLAAIGALLPPPPPGAEGPFALSPPGKLEELVEAAGLVPQQADEVPTPYIYPDLDTAVRAQLAAGPSRMAIEHAGLLPAVDAIKEAFRDSKQPDGSYRQDNSFRYLIAIA